MFVEHMPEESAATFLGASQFFLKPMVKLCGCLVAREYTGWFDMKKASYG